MESENPSSIPSEPLKRFRLKIRQVSHSQFEVLVTSDMTVQDLKSILSVQLSLPNASMRLISSGKLLQDEKYLSDYKLTEGSVVQLTSKPESQEVESSEQQSGRRLRSIEMSERLETIRQNLTTSKLMFDILNYKSEDEIVGFDNSRRKFYPGQWVDVLDTVEQWLEAQIIEIANTSTGSMVFVHYNGWPSQWDEWLDSASPRIQPFHSYTNQSITAPMHSPHPTVPVDESQIRIQGPSSVQEIMQNGAGLLGKMKVLLEKFHKANSIYKFEKAAEKVLEKRSRIGLDSKEEIKDCFEENENLDLECMELDQESVESVEVKDCEMGCESELALLTVQTAPLLDRIGRLLTDMAGLQQGTGVPVMPTPEELSQISANGRNDMGIHIYAFVTPRRGGN